MNLPNLVRTRARAAGIHLAASAAIAALAALLVFQVWYPSPFSAVAGGFSLFVLVVSVDVVMGPMLTAVVASPGKSRADFQRDLSIILMLQLSAFTYGMFTIAEGRPVLISFEIDRFRVVTAADIDAETLKEAPPTLRQLSWLGPKMIAAVKPTDPNELMKATELGLAGFDLSMVPRNWRPYEFQREAAWRRARPSATLIDKYPKAADGVLRIAVSAGMSPGELRFLPVLSRRASWVALIALPDSRIVGYLPLDGFF